ncbi:MAG: tripartite tricarboxylate transporter substrate binding protein, partial [Burkholderiaceae bacterium]|nr:tripartite tricarboxylate transporter substrate binding protein [Burkholderiaceae bacterium]
PDVPTMKEATGLTDFVIYGWQGVLAPAATPPALVERISQEVAKALANPALKARLSGQGTEPAYQGPAQFRSYIAGEQTRWANVISSAKITLD